MPPRRLQVDTRGLEAPALRPSASPVDTFTRTGAGQDLAQLAQGLSRFAPGLAAFAGQMQQQDNKQQRERGEMEARRLFEQGKTFKQAVDEGLIPKSANPFYVAGARETFGRVMADRMDQDIRDDMNKTPGLKESTTLADFDQFYQQKREAWMDANVGAGNRDAFFERGFGTRSEERLLRAREQFTDLVGRNVEGLSITGHFAEMKQHVRDSLTSGLSLEDMARDIDAANAALIARGETPLQVYRTALRAIGEAAQEAEQGGLNIAKLLGMVKGTDGLALRDMGDKESQFARELTQTIGRADMERTNRERTTAAIEREERSREVLGAAVTRLLTNPADPLMDLLGDAKDIPETLDAINAARGKARDLTNFSSPEVEGQTLHAIWLGDATVASVLRTPGLSLESSQRMVNEVLQRDALARTLRREDAADERDKARAKREVQDAYRGIVRNPQFTRALTQVRGAFVPLAAAMRGESTEQSRAAEAELMRAWVQWQSTDEGSLTDPDRINTWLQAQVAAVIQSHQTVMTGGLRVGGAKAGADSTRKLTPPALDSAELNAIRQGRPAPTVGEKFRKAGYTNADRVAMKTAVSQQLQALSSTTQP